VAVDPRRLDGGGVLSRGDREGEGRARRGERRGAFWRARVRHSAERILILARKRRMVGAWSGGDRGGSGRDTVRGRWEEEEGPGGLGLATVPWAGK
jgi:hypothetical protein